MFVSNMHIFCITQILALVIQFTNCESSVVVQQNKTLPLSISSVPTAHNEDTIYAFNEDLDDGYIKYNTTSETVQIIDQTRPNRSQLKPSYYRSTGSAVLLPNDTLYLYGGWYSDNERNLITTSSFDSLKQHLGDDRLAFQPVRPSSKNLTYYYRSVLVWPKTQNSVYLVGKNVLEIYKEDGKENSYVRETIANTGISQYQDIGAFAIGDTIYMVDYKSHYITKYNIITRSIERLIISNLWMDPICVVGDEVRKVAYVIAKVSDEDDKRFIKATLMTFDPATEKISKPLDLINFPGEINTITIKCSFIEKHKKIYILGGCIRSGCTSNKILTIDVSNINVVEGEMIVGRKGGLRLPVCNVKANVNVLHPDPTACSRYYQCQKDTENPIHVNCHGSLHFNPKTQKCEDPDIVKCHVTYDG